MEKELIYKITLNERGVFPLKMGCYLVKFFDTHQPRGIPKERIVHAHWNGKTFVFDKKDFVNKDVIPTFTPIGGKHFIAGWVHINDFKIKKQENKHG